MPNTVCDWNEVVELDPKGYVELNDGQSRVLHGPIDSIVVNEMDFVEIQLKWQATMALTGGVPTGKWEASNTNEPICFPNLVVPFEIEETPVKGRRVRFGLNIIYLDAIEGVSPDKVEGLVLDDDGRQVVAVTE